MFCAVSASEASEAAPSGHPSSGCSSDMQATPATDLPPGAENLVSVVVSVLEQEEDHDGQEQVLLVSVSM